MRNSKLMRVIVYIVIVLIAITVISKYFSKTNWEENFKVKEDNAFDLSIFSKEIDSLLPNKKINKYDTNINRYIDYELNPELTSQTLLIIKSEVSLNMENLESFIEVGNDVFIISNHINIYPGTYNQYKIAPNSKLEFTEKILKPHNINLEYAIDIETVSLTDQYNNVTLGKSDSLDIFVQYKIGLGNLFIHNIPHVFSNHYLVNNSVAYPSAILSYIEQNEVTLILNGFPSYKKYVEEDENDSLLYFILNNKFLKTAWFLFIISCLLFILFKIKRTQRIIPIFQENKNKTLEFIKTISSIYYNEKNNLEIVKKLNRQFLDKIEKRYNIKTDLLDHDFILKLASVTTTEVKIVEEAITKIKFYNYSSFQPSHKDINKHYINLKKIIN